MEKMTQEEFTRKAILKLRTGTYKGIHTRFSGFNQAFRTYFGEDPIEGVNKLIEARKIMGHPSKGGFTIYVPEDAKVHSSVFALDRILAEDEPPV
jgi:hypothetical protein